MAGITKRQIASAIRMLEKLGYTVTPPADAVTDTGDFDAFWELYDKRVDIDTCRRLWRRMTDVERRQCMQSLPAYVAATPDKQYRRDPAGWLRNKGWQNEIVGGKPRQAPGVGTIAAAPPPPDQAERTERRRRDLQGMVAIARQNPRSACVPALTAAYRSGELREMGIDWEPN